MKNKKILLTLEIKRKILLTCRKIWGLKNVKESEFIERSFKFSPIYDEQHTYKISLSAVYRNILSYKLENLKMEGTFYVAW